MKHKPGANTSSCKVISFKNYKDKKISGHTPATDKEIINYIDTNNLSYGKTMKNI